MLTDVLILNVIPTLLLMVYESPEVIANLFVKIYRSNFVKSDKKNLNNLGFLICCVNFNLGSVELMQVKIQMKCNTSTTKQTF